MYVYIVIFVIVIIGLIASLKPYFSSNKEVMFTEDFELEEKLRNAKSKDRRRVIHEYYEKKGKEFLNSLKTKYGTLTIIVDPFGGSGDFSEGSHYIIDMQESKKILICEKILTPIGIQYLNKDFPKIFDYSDIMEYEVYEEDVAILPDDIAYTSKSKTNTTSLIKRATVGAVFAGGVGAIIGGTTAIKESVIRKNSMSEYLRFCSVKIAVKGRREFFCIDSYKNHDLISKKNHYDEWQNYIQAIDYVLADIVEFNSTEHVKV